MSATACAARRGGAVLLLAVFTAAAVPAASAQQAPRLRSFLGKAKSVVSASVAGVDELDNGRLAVAHLATGDVLQRRGGAAGEAPPEAMAADVIEMRDLPVPSVFEKGARGIAFLRPARRNSYLSQQLGPGGPYSELVEPRRSWLVAASDADLRDMSEIVAALVAASKGTTGGAAKDVISPRQLTFRLLAARHPLLVEDGADSLAGIADLAASLSVEEQSTLESALGRGDLPQRVRERLIAAVAANDLRQMVPALRDLDEPDLQRVAWEALRKLGAPVSEEALDDRLRDPRAATRIAAVREILAREPRDGVARVAPLALADADQEVRLAAIEALGATKSREAIAPLERVFAGAALEERQAAASALLAIGGEGAADAFARLAFTGPLDAQRLAVFALLSTGVGMDDPRVRHIKETHSDEKIVHMLEHGIEISH